MQDRESSPAKDRCSTSVPRNQLHYSKATVVVFSAHYRYRYLLSDGEMLTALNEERHIVCVQRQRTSGRRQRVDDNFYSDAASETSSVCSETSFRTGSEMSDV